MRLYKFRTLENIEFVLDIVLCERLYCSYYSDLNDPFEGLFNVIIGGMQMAYSNNISVAKSLQNLLIESGEENLNICSLSSSLEDVRLWSHYADGHRGIAIAIDFPEMHNQLFPVTYSETLPSFAGGILAEKPTIKEVLSCKTNHWDYEAEYRLFHYEKYFPIPNMIKVIYLGSRIPSTKRELLYRIIPKEIALYETIIDRDKIVVKPDRHIERF